MKLQLRCIFIALLSALTMLKVAIASPLLLPLPVGYQALDSIIHEKLDAKDIGTFKLLQRTQPDGFLIFKNFKNEASHEQQGSFEPKQIPIVSDIERIKKVIEIIEFIGGKVDTIIESLPVPQAQAQPDIVEVEVSKKVQDDESFDVNETTLNSTYTE